MAVVMVTSRLCRKGIAAISYTISPRHTWMRISEVGEGLETLAGSPSGSEDPDLHLLALRVRARQAAPLPGGRFGRRSGGGGGQAGGGRRARAGGAGPAGGGAGG